jgi:dUTP pyrophosphatase
MKQNLVLKIKKINDQKQPLPSKAHPTDAGFDIYTIDRQVIASQSNLLFRTGLAFEIPEGYFVKIFDRSGNAARTTLTVVAGVIDSDYRGEVKILVANYGDFPTTVEANTAIAQGILLPLPKFTIKEVTELSETQRSDAGFGSTDKPKTEKK